MGRILHVNLSKQKSSVQSLPQALCKQYIGGVGFSTRLLFNHVPRQTPPLHSDNALIFATGPFAGTMFPTGNKHSVTAKSPLTGFIGDSLSGSFWTHEVKKAGYDAIVVKGKATKLSYLFIDDDHVQIRDAQFLTGYSIPETEILVKEDLEDETVKVASIGVAGENRVLFANIANDRRTAGRTGGGAVMGSKNLKAIAVRGTNTVYVADIEKLIELCLALYEKAQGPATEKYRILGTPANVLALNRIACLPTRNWQQATFEGAEKVSGEYMLEHHVTNIVACSSCPIACDHNCTVQQGPYAGATTSIDYESLYALGPNCGIDSFPAIIKACELCDQYGIDTISTGVTIGWVMECYERGLITKKATHGLEAKFGNQDAVIQLIHLTAQRHGFGALLALGVKKASEKLGKGSEHFAMHVKGLELPGYDIRGLKTAALGWAVAARGGCHNKSGAYDPDISGEVNRFQADSSRGKIVMNSEDFVCIMDSLAICKFLRRCFDDFYTELAEFYTIITGIDMTVDELKRAGERISNLKKAFNIREGWTRQDDSLPTRVMKEPIPDGVAKGSVITGQELDMMLDAYYKARGWSQTGLLTKKKIHELELKVDHKVMIQ
jgi:aldehyde:ferredoxin oxidoreductase